MPTTACRVSQATFTQTARGRSVTRHVQDRHNARGIFGNPRSIKCVLQAKCIYETTEARPLVTFVNNGRMLKRGKSSKKKQLVASCHMTNIQHKKTTPNHLLGQVIGSLRHYPYYHTYDSLLKRKLSQVVRYFSLAHAMMGTNAPASSFTCTTFPNFPLSPRSHLPEHSKWLQFPPAQLEQHNCNCHPVVLL